MPCNFHLRGLAEHVKEGVRAAGGTPMEFNTVAVSDGVTMGTQGMKASLISREVIADSIELMARGYQFDAIVALCACDKTIPGYDECGAEAGGARGVGEAVQREAVQEGLRHPEAVRRNRLHDARAHLGAADASRSTACCPDSPAKARRPCCRPSRWRRSACGSCRIRIRTRSRSCSRRTCAKIAPKTVELKFTRMHGGKPWMTSFDNPFVQAAGRAIEQGFGKTPVFTREGGSIPVVSTFQEELGLPSVLFGVGLPDENAHAPNEKLDLGNFHNGIIASAILYDEIAQHCSDGRFRAEPCRGSGAAASSALQRFYGALPPPPRDPFTLFVWEVLSVALDAAQARRGARAR